MTDAGLSQAPDTTFTSGATQQQHSTGDRILSALVGVKGLVGSLVANFPGSKAAASSGWLDEWFLALATAIHKKEAVLSCDSVPAEIITALSTGYDARCSMPFRLLSIEPRYFRGFRVLSEPISLAADLVVLEGRNSHGKTSVAEALEWLFTGSLSRRESGAQGNARELESCVGNHFRPIGEATWVEARLQLDGGSSMFLRRTLLEDYGNTTTSRCASQLERDGVKLSANDERVLLEKLLAGCPPLLMQHTLGQFIHSGPANRRQYFERLLQLEELTELIERAVIGTRVATMPAPTGGVGRARWEALKTSLKVSASKSRMRAAEQAAPEEWASTIPSELTKVAVFEFGAIVAKTATFDDAVAAIAGAQGEERRRSFPLLSVLRPKRVVDASAEEVFTTEGVAARLRLVDDRAASLEIARRAADSISEAERAISQAMGLLDAAGLIPSEGREAVTCPVCAHSDTPTLTPARIAEVRAWEPATAAVALAEERCTAATSELATHLQTLLRLRSVLIPSQPQDEQWEPAIKDAPPAVNAAATIFRDSVRKLEADLRAFDESALTVEAMLKARPIPETATLHSDVDKLVMTLGSVLGAAREYAALLKALEDTVGSQATEGGEYTQRQRWLDAASDPIAIANDFSWSRAVKSAQDLLAETRARLMASRQELLDRHRQELTAGFKTVWDTLRSDRYSAFHELAIPEPSGKGFKVEIQVKAQLDDGATQAEVDALRVFSESQVNVLGIAAFVTRAKLLGHRVLVFDDPVQSMDEDHFKSFAGRLVPSLIDAGFQVVLLTHNDTFARDISYSHAERESYATVTISHARKSGCRVDLDNRRFSERLRRARSAVDDGDLGEGWKVLRFAIERLYMVAYIKHGPKTFKPASWVDQSAESMFNQGVSVVLDTHAPGMSTRLQEILRMTAAGAHDKAPPGETDFSLAVQDLEILKGKLAIVD